MKNKYLWSLLICVFLAGYFIGFEHKALEIESTEPKQGNIVVLGEGGSMRLATKEELSILSSDTIQGKDIETNLGFLIDTNSMYIIQCHGYYTLNGYVSNINTPDLYKD